MSTRARASVSRRDAEELDRKLDEMGSRSGSDVKANQHEEEGVDEGDINELNEEDYEKERLENIK
jgi:hypothetical protein